jgi:dGTPase
MLSAQVYDVIDATRGALEAAAPADADAVRRAAPLVLFSETMRAQSTELKQFLFRNLYRHPRVMQTTSRAKEVVRELFAAYIEDAQQMPASYAQRDDRYRAVADYIAGMTDRFAIREHERITGRQWHE